MKVKLITIAIILILTSCVSNKKYTALQNKLSETQAFTETLEQHSKNQLVEKENQLHMMEQQINLLNQQLENANSNMNSSSNNYESIVFDKDNTEYDFKLKKNIKDLDLSRLKIPEEYLEADIVEKSYGTGDDIDELIGNIVRLVKTEGNNKYFQDLTRNFKKPNVNVKLKTPSRPFIYKEKFDYNTGQGLNFILGNISNSEDFAYLFEIIKLNDITITAKEIDIERLREAIRNLTNEDKSTLYIVMGATNYSSKTTTYTKSNLKGNFDYAINIFGNKYSKTEQESINKRIAIKAIPIDEFLKLQ